ncbi:hypothetical protein [Moraxella lacunata]|uniref:hypothetical protein n=1 Tax=Moraxella lacunata TaxID=477 RepID=UPI003EE00F83
MLFYVLNLINFIPNPLLPEWGRLPCRCYWSALWCYYSYFAPSAPSRYLPIPLTPSLSMAIPSPPK